MATSHGGGLHRDLVGSSARSLACAGAQEHVFGWVCAHLLGGRQAHTTSTCAVWCRGITGYRLQAQMRPPAGQLGAAMLNLCNVTNCCQLPPAQVSAALAWTSQLICRERSALWPSQLSAALNPRFEVARQTCYVGCER
jgi:hypothetical protein